MRDKVFWCVRLTKHFPHSTMHTHFYRKPLILALSPNLESINHNQVYQERQPSVKMESWRMEMNISACVNDEKRPVLFGQKRC